MPARDREMTVTLGTREISFTIRATYSDGPERFGWGAMVVARDDSGTETPVVDLRGHAFPTPFDCFGDAVRQLTAAQENGEMEDL